MTIAVDEQQCRILECYHDAFISSSNFDDVIVSHENIGRDLNMEEEDLLPPSLARLWSYNDDEVGRMHPSINQVADSLIPDFDEDGMSESESPDVVDQCINDDSYEVQVADSLIPMIGDDGMSESTDNVLDQCISMSESPDVLDQCINDDSHEVEKLLLQIKLSSSALDNYKKIDVEIAQTPPKSKSIFDSELSPIPVTIELAQERKHLTVVDVATPSPTTESETGADTPTSVPLYTTACEENATSIRANAMALLKRADRVDSHALSVGHTTTQDITPVSFEVNTVESAENCSLTADSTISMDAVTPRSTTMIRSKLCDCQQEIPSTPKEIEESCSLFSSLFGSASPPSPSPSILISSADEDIVDADPESFECVLHEFLNGTRSVTKVTPSASPGSETIIVDMNGNLSLIRPPLVGRMLDVGANFNPAKQQADKRKVAGSGGKVRVKNDLSWIKT